MEHFFATFAQPSAHSTNRVIFVTDRAQIWRFKEENRALMRRLYGDLESNSVYREMRASNMASAAASAKSKQSAPSSSSSNLPLDGLFSSLEYNIRLGSGLATVQGSREQV